jgi:small GTP-binding protein
MKKKLRTKTREIEKSTPYYKLVLIGENEVGKTQLLHRMSDENFDEKYSPTFGLDFRIKPILGDKGKHLGDLQIIDIAGDTDDIHKNIESDFINDANAFLCLFDISNVYSLDKAIRIMESYKSKISSDLNTKKWYLVGNKKDLDKKGNEVPNYYKTKFENYFEISTKTSKDEVFQRMIRDITHDLNLVERENKNFNFDTDNNSQNEQFNIDDLFNEECNIF